MQPGTPAGPASGSSASTHFISPCLHGAVPTLGILSGDVAHGAVICLFLFLFPFLLIAVVFVLRALRRREI